MAETNATVNQKKIVDCYMPLVHSNSSSINIDDSLSGVDDPIPIIDFSMLISDDPDKQFKTTQDLRNACLEYGSFMVINHELPDNLIIRVYEALGKFFDLRKEEKQEYETNDPTDMIRWGKWDSNLLSTEFIKMVVHPTFHCPTKLAGLSEILQECIKRMRELGIQLLRAISKTLGFEECYIEKRMNLESGHDFISANDYLVRLNSENQLGQPPHYDTGLLVLLLPGESNGLQIEHHGKWINVNPQPNSIVVIIADHIEVINHELPDKLIIRVYEALGKFFDLRKEEKQEYETNDPTDMIRWGKWDSNLLSTEFIKMVVHPTFHCPTKLAGLSEILQECIERMRELGIQLLRAISKTLGFEECYIEKRMKLESGHDFISANDYLVRLNSENQLGQPPHYDTGLLVLLLPGESNGLQIEHHGKWINVNPQPNSIVVIRISLPLFLGPSLDTTVSPMPEFVDEHHPPAYLVKTYKESLETNPYQVIDGMSCMKNVRL
ncbi:2-oxoglutarate-dependent dioxygenase 19 [Quercus suber]|uniref:2-oxoglutarate-dependent dioxygenase 19 n=1 Tax=Quercus suber TaxID=58331 RepID=UPI0032DF2528